MVLTLIIHEHFILFLPVTLISVNGVYCETVCLQRGFTARHLTYAALRKWQTFSRTCSVNHLLTALKKLKQNALIQDLYEHVIDKQDHPAEKEEKIVKKPKKKSGKSTYTWSSDKIDDVVEQNEAIVNEHEMKQNEDIVDQHEDKNEDIVEEQNT